MAMRMSMPPSSSCARSTTDSACSVSDTSATSVCTGPPMAAAATSRRDCERAAMTTVAPSATSAFAHPRPKPLEPPVMSARRPVRPSSMALTVVGVA